MYRRILRNNLGEDGVTFSRLFDAQPSKQLLFPSLLSTHIHSCVQYQKKPCSTLTVDVTFKWVVIGEGD